MKKLKTLVLLFTLSLLAFTTTAQSDKDKEVMKDADEAKKTLIDSNSEFKNFFDKAAGYVIFPNVGKGGFIIGGASGNGVVYQKGKKIGMSSLKKINIGLQAGGEAVIEVIFFETQANLDEFKKGKYEFDAEASATVVKKGESFHPKFTDGVAVYTQTKGGLMADASIGGQKFEYHPFY